MRNYNFRVMNLISLFTFLIILSLQCFAQESKSDQTTKSDSSWNAFTFKHSFFGLHNKLDYDLPYDISFNNGAFNFGEDQTTEEVLKQNLDDYLMFYYNQVQKNDLGIFGSFLGLSKYIAAFALLIIHLIKYKRLY